MIYNACLMDWSKSVSHLATSVWKEANYRMKPPLEAVQKSEIPKDKKEIYDRVAEDCLSVVEAIRKKLALVKAKP